MKKIIVSIACCLFVFPMIAKAQTYGGLPNIMSPEAATLGKFGAYPVSYYTGAVNVSIPLYTIKENDISLDLSLQNNASGFIPNMEDGITGLNWSLMAGGVITRQVNWSPDDLNDPNGNNMNSNKGFIYGMLQGGLGTFSKDYIKTLGFLQINSQYYPYSNLPYEYSPDVFSFNFNGHNGRFFLGNDGVVKVSSERNYKVDLTNMSGQYELCNCNYSAISITTDDGDIYTFGGDINALQITYPYQAPETRSISCYGGVINAWYLKSIQTHNGRTITFNYEPQDKSVLFAGSDPLHYLDPSVDYVYEKIFYNDKYELVATPEGPQDYNTFGIKYRSLIKTVYLSSIVTPTTRIDFTYSQKPYEFYGAGLSINHNKPKKLDLIQVKDAAGTPLKNITMEYASYGNSTIGYRNFLNKVNFKDASNSLVSSFQFDYYNTSFLPDPLTKGIDVWGYYNGNTGNSTLIPTISSGSPNFDITFTGRAPNSSLCDIGLLKKITYPTGGWSEFTYQGHDYSKVLRKTVQSGMTPVWFTENGSVGGARIAQITNSEGITQSFFYKKNYDPNDPNVSTLTSSGILTDHNIFYLDLQYFYNNFYQNNWGNARNVIVQDNNIAPSSSYGETPIGYSEVTELVTGNGYTKFFYTTQETNPDIYDQGTNSYRLTPNTDNSFTNYFQQMKRLVKYSSCDLERGKLLKTAVYKNENNTSTLMREIINQYNTDSWRYNESVMGFNHPHMSSSWAIFHSYAVYYFQNNITQQTVKDYLANGVVSTTTTNYSYVSNSNPLLRSQSLVNSKGQTKALAYKYPIDFTSSASDNPYSMMVNANKVSAVVEKTESVNNLVTQSQLYPYKSYGTGKILNDETYELDLPNVAPISDKTLTTYDYGANLKFDPRYRLTNKIYYDPDNNISTAAAKDNNPVAMLWGYGGQLPVAKVVNANNIYASGATNNPAIQSSSIQYLSGTKYVNYIYPIEVTRTGNVNVSFSYSNPYISGDNYSKVVVGLEGVSNPSYLQNQMLCAKSLYSTNNCDGYPSSFSFVNVQPGRYNVKAVIITVYGMDPNYYGYQLSMDYPSNRDKIVTANNDLAYTSFETSETGNWTGIGTSTAGGFCPTGVKSYQLSSGQPISKSVSSGTAYIVSYWSNTGSPFSVSGSQSVKTGRSINGWTYYEHIVSGVSSVNVSGNGGIDELRLYPSNALMKTYTYNQVLGVTSECDENNRITYYGYDSFGRLSLVRDQDNNIIKKICYDYAGVVTNCN